MKVINGLKYTKDHEWVKVDGNKAFIGITDYAQHHLGDIVFVELPEVGDDYQAGDVLGVVESVKAASDYYTQVSGTVIEVNDELTDTPGLINQKPYDSWLAVLELSDAGELEKLMDTEEYEKYCTEED